MASPSKRLILFPQDKGGIGKSFIATLLHDYLCDQEIRLKSFDLDHANSTFQRFVPEAEFINTDVDGDKLGVLDRIVHALDTTDTVLVDNRASGGDKILSYLSESRLPQLQEELDCMLVFVVIATDDKDANSQIAELLDHYESQVSWLVVRNHHSNETLPLYTRSNSRQRLQKLGASEIDAPRLAEVTRNRLQQANLTVRRGRTSDQLHLLDRSRCIQFHDRMATEFAKAQHLLRG